MTAHPAPTEALWKNYAFYNREMLKFIQLDDVDMFLTLRDKLLIVYEELSATPQDGFLQTPEGKALLREMIQNTRLMQSLAQRWLNGEKQKQSVTRAYDSLGIPGLGGFKDWNG